METIERDARVITFPDARNGRVVGKPQRMGKHLKVAVRFENGRTERIRTDHLKPLGF